jgi:DNA-binding IclR family transcriptional regulator
VLQLIHAHPGRRAADLAPQLSWDTATFKRQVRKLKALGLTISLETGYQLSSRGEQVVQPAVQP